MNLIKPAILMVLTMILVSAPACTQDEAAPPSSDAPAFTALPAVTAGPALPERLQAAAGVSLTSSKARLLWGVTSSGVSTLEIPSTGAVSAGRLGATVAFWDEVSGDVRLWYPRDSAKADVSFTIDMPGGGPSPGASIALSPNETLLAVARLEKPREGPQGNEQPVARGYLVDLSLEEVSAWEWLDSVAEGYQVVQLQWGKTSTSVYVSLGGEDGRGVRSYRYDVWTEEAVELSGIGTVLDNGYLDQVLGLEATESSEGSEAETTAARAAPLVVWRDGESTPLPGHPGLVSRYAGWISDNGRTVVIQGAVGDEDGVSPCFEVLRRGETGWDMHHLFVSGDSLSIVQGVGFEPNSSIFWFQGGLPENASDGSDSGTYLCELETYQGVVLSPALTLPGDADDLIGVLGAVVAEDCEAG